MVSKKTIKEYGFETLVEYFEYINESIINGQRTQAHDLIDELSRSQKKEAHSYFDYLGEDGEEAKEMIVESL